MYMYMNLYNVRHSYKDRPRAHVPVYAIIENVHHLIQRSPS